MTASALIADTLFSLFALVTAGSALGVVVSRNVVHTAVCLLLALLGVAGLYFLLSAEFLAAVQLVVYVGGTLILIVFGVMLTSRSQFARVSPGRREVLGVSLLSVLLLCVLITAIVRERFPAAAVAGTDLTAEHLGVLLLGRYLAPFELASVVLLIVMIGSAYLARNRKLPPQESVQ